MTSSEKAVIIAQIQSAIELLSKIEEVLTKKKGV